MGMNKQQIMDLGKTINTYNISIQPQEDCCVFYASDHPATSLENEEILKLKKCLEVDKPVNSSPDNIRKENKLSAEAEIKL